MIGLIYGGFRSALSFFYRYTQQACMEMAQRTRSSTELSHLTVHLPKHCSEEVDRNALKPKALYHSMPLSLPCKILLLSHNYSSQWTKSSCSRASALCSTSTPSCLLTLLEQKPSTISKAPAFFTSPATAAPTLQSLLRAVSFSTTGKPTH